MSGEDRGEEGPALGAEVWRGACSRGETLEGEATCMWEEMEDVVVEKGDA